MRVHACSVRGECTQPCAVRTSRCAVRVYGECALRVCVCTYTRGVCGERARCVCIRVLCVVCAVSVCVHPCAVRACAACARVCERGGAEARAGAGGCGPPPAAGRARR